MGLPWKGKKHRSTCQDEWFPPRKKIRRILHGEGKTLVFDVQTKFKAKQIAGRKPPPMNSHPLDRCLPRPGVGGVCLAGRPLRPEGLDILVLKGMPFKRRKAGSSFFWVPKGFFP